MTFLGSNIDIKIYRYSNIQDTTDKYKVLI